MSLRKLFELAAKEVPTRRSFSLHKLSEQHRILQKTCRDFAETELKPIAADLDREGRFPAEQIRKLGQLGLLGISAPKTHNGSGLDTLAIAVAVEEIARGCGGTGSIVAIHNCLYAGSLSRLGTEAQKQEFLKPFTSEALGCFALNAGSDVSAISTTATLDGDHYVLNGTKSWVTNAPVGKAAIVFATVDKKLKHKGLNAFIVPLPTNGVTLGKRDKKLGIRASQTCNLTLENAKIPKSNMLGNLGDGFVIAMNQLDFARVGIAAQALGIAQAALELAVSYANQRHTFGQPISHFQAVKLRLAAMATRLESARLLVWRAACLCDEPQRSTKESSMAKVAASEAATFVTHGAIQILGAMGFVDEMPAERHYRDARITEIYAGVNDIQKLLIGDAVTNEYK